MSAPTSSFELAWKDRRIGASQTPRRFLDFIADGRSLHARHGGDLVSPLGWAVPAEDERAAARLLRKAPPDAGDRVAIYVCAECGDLDCGAITAIIERDGNAIVWRNFAMSSPDDEPGAWHHDTKPFEDWPALRFSAHEYWEAISRRSRSEGPR